MNKTIILISAITIGTLFTITSCAKKGCTDSKAQNYDSAAKTDDGSCSYPADKFVGSFKIKDSIFNFDGFSYTFLKIENYTSITEKIDSLPNKIKIKNFASVGYDVVGTFSGNDIVFSESITGASGDGTLLNDTLHFKFQDFYFHSGFGIKQP
jgi:hypothetical protein